jgi:hypothetical protein
MMVTCPGTSPRGPTDTELLGSAIRQRAPWLGGSARVVNALTTQPVRRGVLPPAVGRHGGRYGGSTPIPVSGAERPYRAPRRNVDA